MQTSNNGNKNNTGKKPGAVAVILFVILAALLPEDADMIPVAVIAVLIIAAIVKTIKKPAGKGDASRRNDTRYAPDRRAVSRPVPTRSSQEHNHDRLTGGTPVPESEAEHYRRQLDSFLKAGIIEKDEYRILLQRYTGSRR